MRRALQLAAVGCAGLAALVLEPATMTSPASGAGDSAWKALALHVAPALAQADDKARLLAAKGARSLRIRKYKEAIKHLKGAIRACRKSGCAAETKAKIYSASGVAYALDGDGAKSRVRFEWALAENAEVKPDRAFATRKVMQAFRKAKANVDGGSGAPPPSRIGSLSVADKVLLEQAQALYGSKDYEACFGMLVTANFPEGKLQSARCQDQLGLMLEARKEATTALGMARDDENEKLAKKVEAYLGELNQQIPRIKVKLQSGVRNVVVKVDGKAIPKERVKKSIEHNPGTAVIEVVGKRGGQPYEVKQRVRFQRNETIEVVLSTDKTPLQVCYEKARNRAERGKCDKLFNVEQGLNVKAGLEVATYNDNDNTHVVSPALFGAAVQPTDGWNIAGSVIVDLVTTASTDIVTTASRRYDDRRFGADVGGGYKIGGLVTLGLSASVSIESDYIGRTFGGNLSADVLNKMVTPYIGYSAGIDTIGRADTDWDVFSRPFRRHNISAGASIIFSPMTVGVAAFTLQVEDGDQSKPYRHVAMFPTEAVDDLPRAAAKELTSAVRLPIMPLEQLPLERYRYAVLLRAMHRFDSATLRASERFYMDSWGQIASSTDARFMWDFFSVKDEDGTESFPQLSFNPHVRFHIQGPTDFWRRAYVATPGVAGYELPAYRTADRELGPLLAVTGGLGVGAKLSEMFVLGVQAEGIYTQFLDHLYLYDRFGLFTSSTLEILFQ